MTRTILRRIDDLRLDLVEPDDTPFPFWFETICLRCQAVVATSTYQRSDEQDQAIARRVRRDAERDLTRGVLHLATCTMADA